MSYSGVIFMIKEKKKETLVEQVYKKLSDVYGEEISLKLYGSVAIRSTLSKLYLAAKDKNFKVETWEIIKSNEIKK